MTPGWYALASCANTVPGMKPTEYPAYALSSQTVFIHSQDGGWKNVAPWEHPPDELLVDEAVRSLCRVSMSGQKYDVGPVRNRQNPVNCCVTIPVCLLAQHPNGPKYLRNFRRF